MTIKTTHATISHTTVTIPQNILANSMHKMLMMDTDWEQYSKDTLSVQIEYAFRLALDEMGEDSRFIVGLIEGTKNHKIDLKVKMNDGTIEEFECFKDYGHTK